MRKSFKTLIGNDRYQVGCTGGTVYVRDSAGNELAKFKDMPYAYYPALHPDGDMAAVFSNTGLMAIYSLSELRMITKFRVSASTRTSTDCIPCFSPDGKYLYHIESRGWDSLNNRLSIYSTEDFQPVARLFEQGQKVVFRCMEFDENTGVLFITGYFRKETGNEFFIAKLIDHTLQDVRLIDWDRLCFYSDAVNLKKEGFTPFSYNWSYLRDRPTPELAADESDSTKSYARRYSLEDLKRMNFTLSQFWEESGN